DSLCGIQRVRGPQADQGVAVQRPRRVGARAPGRTVPLPRRSWPSHRGAAKARVTAPPTQQPRPSLAKAGAPVRDAAEPPAGGLTLVAYTAEGELRPPLRWLTPVMPAIGTPETRAARSTPSESPRPPPDR